MRAAAGTWMLWRLLSARLVDGVVPRLAGIVTLGAASMRESVHRTAEAARDARHRLRTGRPRGVPVRFVHPPLDCSRGCSQAARRVHGLLYGYSLAYAEVRPKAETIAAALQYGKSTVHNAIAELRHAGLLVVNERRGRDGRRVANGYVVLTLAHDGVPSMRIRHSRAQKAPSDLQKARTRIEISSISKPKTTTAGHFGGRQHIKLVPTARRQASAVSEMDLGHILGADGLGQLRSTFGDDLAKMRLVIAEEGAIAHPALAREACEAMLKQRGTIANPAGYLRGILRHQQEQLEGVRDELRELEERQRQASEFGDPNERELERRISTLRERLAIPAAPTPGPATPPLGLARAAATAAPRRKTLDVAPAIVRTQRERGGEPEPIEETVSRLKRSSPALAKILAEQLGPNAPAVSDPSKASSL